MYLVFGVVVLYFVFGGFIWLLGEAASINRVLPDPPAFGTSPRPRCHCISVGKTTPGQNQQMAKYRFWPL